MSGARKARRRTRPTCDFETCSGGEIADRGGLTGLQSLPPVVGAGDEFDQSRIRSALPSDTVIDHQLETDSAGRYAGRDSDFMNLLRVTCIGSVRLTPIRLNICLWTVREPSRKLAIFHNLSAIEI